MHRLYHPASSRSHFYDSAGNPQHEVIGSTTGRPRNSTVADAKKNGWLPSGNTIIEGGMPTSYGLQQYKLNLWANVWTQNRRRLFEAKEKHTKRINKLYQEELRKPPERGSRVHYLLYLYLSRQDYTKEKASPDEWAAFEKGVEWFSNNWGYPMGEAEYVLVGDGYALQVDWIDYPKVGMPIIIDWKTQDKEKPVFYPEWCMYLAAAEKALKGEYLCISVIIPMNGLPVAHKIWTAEEKAHAWELFQSAHNTYRLVHNWPKEEVCTSI